jgi:hypothetical protein
LVFYNHGLEVVDGESNMKHLLPIATTLMLLAACNSGQQDAEVAEVDSAEQSPAVTEPEATSQPDPESTDPLARDPDALREAMRDPDQRAALMEAMRERRGEDPDREARAEEREAMRERMRERREELMAGQNLEETRERMRQQRTLMRGQWWEDEELGASLSLSESQSRSLGDAHQALEQSRVQSRQTLTENQRQLMAALTAVDRDQITHLLEERNQASAALAEAESAWMHALLEQLNDEQIKTLAREYPQLLMVRPRR